MYKVEQTIIKFVVGRVGNTTCVATPLRECEKPITFIVVVATLCHGSGRIGRGDHRARLLLACDVRQGCRDFLNAQASTICSPGVLVIALEWRDVLQQHTSLEGLVSLGIVAIGQGTRGIRADRGVEVLELTVCTPTAGSQSRCIISTSWYSTGGLREVCRVPLIPALWNSRI